MGDVPWTMPGYAVETLLGSGTSGEVWRGRVNDTGAGVALKRIRLDDPVARQAALSEAALLATLDHPHLVRLYELKHVDDSIVLVLDLAGGGSLDDLLAVRDRLVPGEVITALAPIAAALAYAHNAGVVHGDVTPTNVLFTDIGLPLLADLGVSRLLGDQAPVHSTPAYIDPAVAAGCMPGPATDVFMLGAVALRALTGAVPWPGSSVADVLANAAAGEIGDVAAQLASAAVPDAIAEVVCRALDVQPQLRGTAADFALDLRHAGEPLAVELSAGRARIEPSDSRAEPSSRSIEPSRAGAGVAGGRHAAATGSNGGLLTHGVRAPSPLGEATARRGRRTRRTRSGPRRPRTGRAGGIGRVHRTGSAGQVLAGIGLVGLASIAWLYWPRGAPARPSAVPHSHPSTSVSAPSMSAASMPTVSGVGDTRTLAARAPSVASIDARAADQLLRGLDTSRAAAFAQRNPGLLAKVYVPGTLLARDTALLTSIVPTGCGLRGVSTGYSQVAVISRHGLTLQLRVQARLAASALVCAGSITQRAPGAGPARLQIDLVRQADGYRIAGQRAA